jgi:hypothetical protein
MLHIHNGDSTANIAKHAAIPGEHFPWREALIEGPTPGDVTGDEWIRLRAQYLSTSYGEDFTRCERELKMQEEKLASFEQHEEVVLWFEHDLFCQVHLIYLLQYFAKQNLQQTKLSLICIDNFPGKDNFRGLGELSSEQLASLFPARQKVTTEQLNLGTSAWKAYGALEPTDVQRLLQSNTSALPFLRNALGAHVRRFPSTRNGLGAIENRALQLINEGVKRFEKLFDAFGRVEPIYGLGDLQFWIALRRMTDVGQALLSTETRFDEKLKSAKVVADAEFEITELGRAVLLGDGDFVALNGINMWLGGVHLSNDRNLWRWDEQSETVVLT